MEHRRRTLPAAPGYWRNPFLGTGADGDTQGNKPAGGKKVKGCAKAAFDFLSIRLDTFPVVKFSELYSAGSYDFLYRSAKNYLKLLGQEIGIPPGGYDFEELYRHFSLALPEDQCCELCRYGADIFFHVIENSAGWELHYIPCAIAGRLEAEPGGLLLDFLRLLQHTQGLTPLKEDPVYRLFISDTGHYSLKDTEKRKNLAEEYEKGHAGELLDRIARPPETIHFVAKLKKRLGKYVSRGNEEGIIALMREGLELMGRGKNRKKKITGYGFFPQETEDYYNCYYPVEAHRTLMIVHEEDMLCTFLSEWAREEAQEQSAEIFSGGNKLITPRTRAPLKADPYVNDFFNWLKRFEHELSDR